MKLIVAVIQDSDSSRLVNALRKSEFQSTKLASTGGFLREGNTTLIIGCNETDAEKALQIINSHCSTRTRVVAPNYPMRAQVAAKDEKPIKVEKGGATVFVLPINSFARF